jgi:pimeloyl-ACP methyl ester carboxylesterase
MKNESTATFVTIAIGVSLFTQAAAAGPVSPIAVGTSMPSPAATMTVGSLQVERFGSGSPAVILIPGLDCGPWLWQAQIRDLAARHAVYAVTLPGFDGVAPIKGRLLDAADMSLQTLVGHEHLIKPVMVGDSLGGFLTIRFAEEHSVELGGAVAVDGYPVFPAMAQMHAADRVKAADQYAAPMRGETQAQFAASQRESMETMITAPAEAIRAALASAKSDPGATAEYVDEMLRADLRPDLELVKTPLLEIAPVPAAKDLPPLYVQAMATMNAAQLAATYSTYDRRLFPGATTLRIAPISDSRHFVMFDQPAAFEAALDAFVDGRK